MQQSCDFKVQHNFLLTEKIISHLISATVGLKFFQHCLSSCSAPKHKNTSILSVYQQAEKGAYECVMSIASCFKHSSSVCSAFSVFFTRLTTTNNKLRTKFSAVFTRGVIRMTKYFLTLNVSRRRLPLTTEAGFSINSAIKN